MQDTYRRLLEAIKTHSGMENPEIREAGEHGADAGWAGFTYTVDGAEFYRANAADIDELLQEMADALGHKNVAEMVSTFTRADMTDTRDGHDCLLAWFALEEVGRWLEDNWQDDFSDGSEEE